MHAYSCSYDERDGTPFSLEVFQLVYERQHPPPPEAPLGEDGKPHYDQMWLKDLWQDAKNKYVAHPPSGSPPKRKEPWREASGERDVDNPVPRRLHGRPRGFE